MKSNGQKASEKQFNTGVMYLRRTRASTTPRSNLLEVELLTLGVRQTDHWAIY